MSGYPEPSVGIISSLIQTRISVSGGKPSHGAAEILANNDFCMIDSLFCECNKLLMKSPSPVLEACKDKGAGEQAIFIPVPEVR